MCVVCTMNGLPQTFHKYRLSKYNYKEIQVENNTHTYDAVSTRNNNYQYVVLFIFKQIISAISSPSNLPMQILLCVQKYFKSKS